MASNRKERLSTPTRQACQHGKPPSADGISRKCLLLTEAHPLVVRCVLIDTHIHLSVPYSQKLKTSPCVVSRCEADKTSDCRLRQFRRHLVVGDFDGHQ